MEENSMSINFRGLKSVLKKFDNNGKYAKGTHWSIANGGYDLWWELYYDGLPILQCVAGELEIAVCGLTESTEKRLIENVKSVYADLR